MSGASDGTGVIACGVVALHRRCLDDVSPPNAPVLLVGFLGSDDDGEEAAEPTEHPALAFLCIARTADEVRGLSRDRAERRFGPGSVLGTAFDVLEGDRAATVRDRFRPGELRPGWSRNIGRPLLIADPKARLSSACRYVVNEYVVPAEAAEGVWYLQITASPRPGGPRAAEFGGAYVNCWLAAVRREDALAAALATIADDGWDARVLTTSRPALRADTPPESAQRLVDARRDGVATVCYTWPAPAAGAE